jgi:hypothetical protein
MNRHAFRALILASSFSTAAVYAADMTPLLSNGPALTPQQEHVAKAVALSFDRTLCGESDPQLAADLFAAPNFVNHDVEEPSGPRITPISS